MAWVLLFCASVLEIAWAYFMKRSDGFSLLGPTALMIAAMIGSFALLAASLKTLPLGTAYTIWTGVGAVGAFAIGVVVMGEALTPMRIFAALFIVLGVVMMKVSTPS